MKKILISLVAMAVMFSVNAQQFYNSEFEDWTSTTKAEDWSGLEVHLSDYGIPAIPGVPNDIAIGTEPISRSTNMHGGQYALKLAASQFNSNIATFINNPLISTYIPDSLQDVLNVLQQQPIPAVLTNGKIDFIGLAEAILPMLSTGIDPTLIMSLGDYITDGLEISQRPSIITGFAKANKLENADMLGFAALVMSEYGGTRHIIGFGVADISAADYEQFNINISYLPGFEGETPSELLLLGYVFVVGHNETDNTSMLIDDLNIVYQTGLIDNAMENVNIAVYPNPNKGKFSIDCKNGSKVVITNMLGQEIVTINNYVNGNIINIEQKGMYFVKVDNGVKQVTKKVIVK
ncbi:MAG: T9SS type A sorting domain-containing protein [Bacteroidales bacterium]|jgi:hypothetical protein|nr:T9SS type A sorting domain-containing protein [Bacteroidales bacterium]